MDSVNRRTFLRALAGGTAFALGCESRGPRSFGIPGEIVNAGAARRGHLLRDRHTPADFPVVSTTPLDIAIVGGGVSGLAAAWKLHQVGVEDFHLFELGPATGGTSLSGGGPGRRFPWGAHYINIPPREADCIHEMLVDVGVITGYDTAGRPQVRPDYLAKYPRERLYMDGAWQSGLDPYRDGVGEEQGRQFEDDMLRWTLYRGTDGRRAFAMPLAYSTTDTAVRDLDRMSMTDYLRIRGWTSRRLHWLVDYCCRDDYGCAEADVSAWAGIHYFACRYYDRRIADEYPSDTLTWEQGNAFLTDAMAERMRPDQTSTNTAVVAIQSDSSGVELACIDVETGERQRLRARAVVYAGKLHTAPHIFGDLPSDQREAMSDLNYSPWLVAALHLSEKDDSFATEMAWENILYEGPSVGYVRVGQQTSGAKTLVYYRPFTGDAAGARSALLEHGHQYWADAVMTDLTRAHPTLSDVVERLDVYMWGHGMVRPLPNVIWGSGRPLRERPHGVVNFATCDVSGLPLFEEAVFAGIRAAEASLQMLDVKYATSIPGLANHG